MAVAEVHKSGVSTLAYSQAWPSNIICYTGHMSDKEWSGLR